MYIVTVIPARGGSKSIPRKNIVKLGGYPLIKYSIDYSLESDLVNQTIVSTDDDEIASIAIDMGADVPFKRPYKLAEDDVPDFPVIFHALQELEKDLDGMIDIIILLRPTSPLRPKGLIEEAVSMLENNPKASSVRAMTKSKEHFYRQWKKDGDYIQSFVEDQSVHEPYNIPRQFLPNSYFQTGDIEVIRRSTLINGSVSGDFVLPLMIDSEAVFDIDHTSDLSLAEKKVNDEKS